ncbi:MAG: peptidylprolyl isomerase [Pseudomonadota bacterium]
MRGRGSLLLGVALAASAFFHPATAALDRIVALVNDGVITASALRATSDQLRAQNPRLQGESLRKAALEQLIMQSLQAQEAERLGIAVDDATLARGMEQLARQNNLTLSAFRKQVESEGVAWASLRENIRSEILLQRLRERVILSSIAVNDNEIDEFLDENRTVLSAKQFSLERFSVPFPRTDTARDRARLERDVRRLLSLLERRQPTASVMATLKREGIPVDNGALGWRTLSQLPQPLDTLTAEMATGDITPPLPDSVAVHVFRLVEQREQDKVEITQTRARHILLKPNPVRDDEQTKLQLLEFREHLIHGGSFDTLAKRHSEDYSSGVVGGELPWFGPGDMVEEFDQAAGALPIGALSGPVRSQFGWHLIEVLERRRENVSESRLREQARERIAQRKLATETDRYLKRLRDEAYLEFPDAS